MPAGEETCGQAVRGGGKLLLSTSDNRALSDSLQSENGVEQGARY